LTPESRKVLDVFSALAPPLRPAPEEIAVAARWWNTGPGARVLVLGATPELVDLALQKGASRVIAMDWQAPVFPAMRRLGRENWEQVESLVSDWRTFVPELEGALDLVVGDGSLTMVPFPEDWETVFRHLWRYLVPGGRVFLRLAIRLEEPFDFDPYLDRTLARFDAECAGATAAQRAALFRGLSAEIRLAQGFGSADAFGVVNIERRVILVRRGNMELTKRCSHWEEWPTLRKSLPTEEEVRQGILTGKGVPRWEDLVRWMASWGFALLHMECPGTRPAPRAMRVFAVERR
jgi:SAM-dependent methyltransferase